MKKILITALLLLGAATTSAEETCTPTVCELPHSFTVTLDMRLESPAWSEYEFQALGMTTFLTYEFKNQEACQSFALLANDEIQWERLIPPNMTLLAASISNCIRALPDGA